MCLRVGVCVGVHDVCDVCAVCDVCDACKLRNYTRLQPLLYVVDVTYVMYVLYVRSVMHESSGLVREIRTCPRREVVLIQEFSRALVCSSP